MINVVVSNNVLVATIAYDAKSRRVKKVTPEATTTFFYDDWNPIEERVAYTNGTSSKIRYYWGKDMSGTLQGAGRTRRSASLPGKDLSGTLQGAGGVGGLLYITVDGAIYVPFYDNIGNITRYLDENGNTVAQYTYDAFGKLIAKSGPLADFFRHRFSTKYFDIETGLYYYGYRFYHPVLMRWLNRDPIEECGGLNLYVYCDNSCAHSFDPNGLTKYWDNYLNLTDYPYSPDAWEMVGGRLFWSFLTIDGYYNSCAIRVSRSLILSGHVISAKAGREKNFDIKATRDAEREGKSAEKGQLLKAESPNARFVINARNVGDLLDELLTDPTVKKIRGQQLTRLLKKQNASARQMAKLFLPMMGTQE